MFITLFLHRTLPRPRLVYEAFTSPHLRWLADSYCWWWMQSQERLITWHRIQLVLLDPKERFSRGATSLMEARTKARDAGIGPMDSRYPELRDFVRIAGSDSSDIDTSEIDEGFPNASQFRD